MDVLITGGLGFIGQALIPRLLAAGCRIRAVDSLDPSVHGPRPDPADYLGPWGDAVEVTIGNVTDRELMRRMLDGVETVVHLASLTSVPGSMRERARYADENVTGTAILCDLIAEESRVRRLVLASSRAVYGEGPWRCPNRCATVEREGVTRGLDVLERSQWDPRCPDCAATLEPLASREDSPLVPASFYGTTKVAQEQLVAQLLPYAATRATVLRLQNVYGPGQKRAAADVGVANILAQRAANGEPTVLFEDGRPCRDYVYIDDVADVFARAALAGLGGERLETFNVGSGRGATLVELVEAIGRATGRAPRVEISGEFRVGDVRHAVADTRRLAAAHDWSPVALDLGLRRLVDWLAAGRPRVGV
jgi:dTDP-L-rhamnose 4-epimerase